MKVKANRTIAYGSIEYSPGDVFEMDDKTANVNIANKRVTQVHTPPKESKPAPKPEAKPEAGASAGTTGEDDAGKGAEGDDTADKGEKGDKGRHKRRDMRAEDDDGEGVS